MSSDADRYEVPEFIRNKHPEMPSVLLALKQHSRNEEITATCFKCGEPLTVTDLADVGVLVVQCATGCTVYRQRTSPHVTRDVTPRHPETRRPTYGTGKPE